VPLPAEVPPVPNVEAEPEPLPAAEPALPTDELLWPLPAEVPPVPSVDAEPEPEPLPAAEPAVPTDELDCPLPADVPPVPSVDAEPEPDPLPEEEPAVPTEELDIPLPAEVPPVPIVELDCASTTAALPARNVAVNAASERLRRIILYLLKDVSSIRECEMESSHATTWGNPFKGPTFRDRMTLRMICRKKHAHHPAMTPTTNEISTTQTIDRRPSPSDF
jgi:hypothetical protein